MFIEKQRFNQWWLWVVFWVVPFVWPINRLFSRGSAAMMHTISEPEWQLTLVVSSVVFLLMFFVIRLNTQINEDGVRVRFSPFHRKERFYPWDMISSCHVRIYKPLLEYGGWGIRFGPNGTAYNIRGNKGIQLVLKNGRQILIGTQKTEEAQSAITKFFHSRKTEA